MTDDTPAPVTPRPAASLLVLQGDAPLVLMGMRGAKHKFMPNRLVFPGGAVDPADHEAPVASPLSPHVLARLEHAATPALASQFYSSLAVTVICFCAFLLVRKART